MLKRKIVVALLGGGAYLVSSAGVAVAQPNAVPHGGVAVQIANPVPMSLPYCDNHYYPTNSVAPVGGAISPMGYLQDPTWYYGSGVHNYASWVDSFPLWPVDRRPMMTVQLGSADWLENPTGNTDKWYIHHYTNSGTEILPDNYFWNDGSTLRFEDNYSQNDDYSSDTVWVSGPNGIPDQFDFLIRTIKRWREYGVRRVLLHLPAGVIGGKLLGYDYDAQGNPMFGGPHDGNANFAILGGTMQSMNQFWGMPEWKRKYFRGEALLDLAPGNGWANFLNEHPDPSDPDHMDIEIYIGGGIGMNSTGLGTEATIGTGNTPQRMETFLGFDGTTPVKENFWVTPYSNHTPPYPIDPRFQANGHSMTANTNMVWHFIGPWIDNCSIKRLWLDAASENTNANARRWGSLELSHNPYLTSRGVRIGGETIPTIDVPGFPTTVDACAVANMPWFVNWPVMSTHVSPGVRAWKAPYTTTVLNRSNTEVHLLDNSDTLSMNQWREARQRGYVVGAYNAYGPNPIQAERMKRWYNMGKIQVVDFDGDGVVEEQDRIDADAIISQNTGVTSVWPRVFGNGDINDDGFITVEDYNEFHLYWNNIANWPLKREYHAPRMSDL